GGLATAIVACLGAGQAWGAPVACRETCARGTSSRAERDQCRLERSYEVPQRLVRRWQGLCRPHEAPPLGAYLEGVTGLTDRQLASLSSRVWEAGLPPDLRQLSAARGALRLYAALGPAQQQALWQGQALPVAWMTPAQRVLFQAAVSERHRSDARPL